MKHYYQIAKREMEQDNFIIWLFYQLNSKNKYLFECSKMFVEKLIENENINNIELIDIFSQFGNGKLRIDIVVILLLDKQHYAIVIEDKINSKINNDLEKYKEIVYNHDKIQKFKNIIIKYICIKTGIISEDDLKKSKRHDFKIFGVDFFYFLKKYVKYNFLIDDFYQSKCVSFRSVEFKHAKIYDLEKFIFYFIEKYEMNNNLIFEKNERSFIYKLKKCKLKLIIKSYLSGDYIVEIHGEIRKDVFAFNTDYRYKKYKTKVAENINKNKIVSFEELEDILKYYIEAFIKILNI